jgi:hypothetical protein
MAASSKASVFQVLCVAAVSVGVGLAVFHHYASMQPRGFSDGSTFYSIYMHEQAPFAESGGMTAVVAGLLTLGILGLVIPYANAFFYGHGPGRSEEFRDETI